MNHLPLILAVLCGLLLSFYSVNGLKCYECSKRNVVPPMDYIDCFIGECEDAYCYINRTQEFNATMSHVAAVTERGCTTKERADQYYKASGLSVWQNGCHTWEAFSQTCLCKSHDFCSGAMTHINYLFVPIIFALCAFLFK